MKSSSDETELSFWDKVIFGECWEWTATKLHNGYGWFRGHRAHRFSWAIFNGEIKEGMMVLHTCDNRKCVRPAHLFLGTAKDNTSDMISKGRGVKPPILCGEKHGMAKLTSDDVNKIRELRGKMKGSEIADMFGVTRSSISQIQLGKVRNNG